MKIIKWCLFMAYTSLVLYVVFFSRRRHGLVWHDDYVNLIPVVNTVAAFHATVIHGWWNFLVNLLGNIVLFVPFSCFMINLFNISSNAVIVALGFCLSVLIEFAQYFWQIGIPDIDDVLLNTAGTVIGVLLWRMLLKVRVVGRSGFSHGQWNR